jgi:hypothetical protein
MRANPAFFFFLSLGLLILTKNEALVLHAPLLILAALACYRRRTDFSLSTENRKALTLGIAMDCISL